MDYGLFWNSRGGDRKYNADDFSEWLRKFFTSGVFQGELFVKSAGGMKITVEAGYCNLDGKVMIFEDSQSFTLDIAYATANRVDSVVIERNDTDRAITVKVVKGGADGKPHAPIRTSGVYQLVIAQIAVNTGVTSISQSNITDTRMYSDLCGYVAGTVDEIEFDQIKAQFDDWFDHFKSNITGDAAAKLQLEIDNLQDEVNVINEKKENKKSWVTVTLSANKWVADSDGTYYYSLENLYPSSKYDINDVVPNRSTTNAMRHAWILADCGGYEESNIIRCHGVTPKIDIVIGLCVTTKGGIL